LRELLTRIERIGDFEARAVALRPGEKHGGNPGGHARSRAM
jgi:hypothetical protein